AGVPLVEVERRTLFPGPLQVVKEPLCSKADPDAEPLPILRIQSLPGVCLGDPDVITLTVGHCWRTCSPSRLQTERASLFLAPPGSARNRSPGCDTMQPCLHSETRPPRRAAPACRADCTTSRTQTGQPRSTACWLRGSARASPTPSRHDHSATSPVQKALPRSSA